jgi:hypothetical protein
MSLDDGLIFRMNFEDITWEDSDTIASGDPVGTFHGNTNFGIIFDVLQPIYLRDFRIEANDTGTITIALKKYDEGASGDVLWQREFTISSTGIHDLECSIPIFEVDRYILYKVEALDLKRSDASYDFDSETYDHISIITGGTTGGSEYDRYYYFFNISTQKATHFEDASISGYHTRIHNASINSDGKYGRCVELKGNSEDIFDTDDATSETYSHTTQIIVPQYTINLYSILYKVHTDGSHTFRIRETFDGEDLFSKTVNVTSGSGNWYECLISPTLYLANGTTYYIRIERPKTTIYKETGLHSGKMWESLGYYYEDSINNTDTIALGLNGSPGQYITTENTSITGLNAITVSCWVKSEKSSSALFNSSWGSFILHFRGAGFYLKGTDDSVSGYLNFDVNPPTNEWVFLTATWTNPNDGDGLLRIYMNGVQQNTTRYYDGGVDNELKDLRLLRLGLFFNIAQTSFVGLISDARLYNRALRPDEITRLYNLTQVDTGLLGYWKMNEGSGDTVYDYSGKGNHGTIENATWSKFSRFKYSLEFKEGNNRVIIPHTNLLSEEVFGTSDTFTISAWVYPRIYENWTSICNKATGGYYSNSTNGMWLIGNGFQSIMGSNIANNPAGSTRSTAFSPPLRNWYHVVTTCNGTHLRIYINGQLKNSVTISALTYPRTPNTSDISVGSRISTNNDLFSGYINELRLYKRGLSDREILNLYHENLYDYNLIINSPTTELFDCHCTRFDISNYTVTVEIILNKDKLDDLLDNIVPGAVGELYVLLGKPKHYDSTWSNANTIILEPSSNIINTLKEMRDKYVVYVKNISSSTIEGVSGRINVKIEGILGD